MYTENTAIRTVELENIAVMLSCATEKELPEFGRLRMQKSYTPVSSRPERMG